MKNPARRATLTTDVRAGVRLDAWLWAARFFKTRALAKHAIEAGKIEINGAIGKPAKPLHAGDRLCIARGDERFEIRVAAIAAQRGSADVAQRLYEETEASRTARESGRERRRLDGGDLLRPATRPDKRSRRLIKQIRDSI